MTGGPAEDRGKAKKWGFVDKLAIVRTTGDSGRTSHARAVSGPEPDWTSCCAAETSEDPGDTMWVGSAASTAA